MKHLRTIGFYLKKIVLILTIFFSLFMTMLANIKSFTNRIFTAFSANI